MLLLLSAQKYYGPLQCPTLIYSVNTRVTKLLAQCLGTFNIYYIIIMKYSSIVLSILF